MFPLMRLSLSPVFEKVQKEDSVDDATKYKNNPDAAKSEKLEIAAYVFDLLVDYAHSHLDLC